MKTISNAPSARKLLEQLGTDGIELRIVGEKLVIGGCVDAVSPQTVELVRLHGKELIAELRRLVTQASAAANADVGERRSTRTSMETIEVTKAMVASWRMPAFQKEEKMTKKVLGIIPRMEEEGVIPGVLQIGVLDGVYYKVDGQHRCAAFLRSNLKSALVDVRFHHCSSEDDLQALSKEFGEINSSLAPMKPDDHLRAMEVGGNQILRTIRSKCPFVGYDMVRRAAHSPLVSMSVVLRMWFRSARDIPTNSGPAAKDIVETMTTDDAVELAGFLNRCISAWGRDPEYSILWNALNLTMVAWLYRRVVLKGLDRRRNMVNGDSFRRALMALSANENYCDWLRGRQLGDRERSPAFTRIKEIMARSIEKETGEKVRWPQPAWAANVSRGR